MSRVAHKHSATIKSTKVALIAVLTGLALGTNYAMIDLPNVKFMDAIVFVAAYLFGLDVGVGVAVLSWSVYGYVNPWGQAPPNLLPFLMLGEAFYAVAAVLLRRGSPIKQPLTGTSYWTPLATFGIVGFLATFAYDVLTNFATYLFQTTSPLNALLIGMATGATFAIIHELSNLLFFMTVAPLTISAARRFLTGAIMGETYGK